MTDTGTAGPGGGAVRALGVATLLVGAAYGALGVHLILGGAAWFAESDREPWGQVASLFGLGPALVIALGAAFVLPGLLGLLAGLGLLRRRRWGRVLAFVLAGLAALLGLAWAIGGDRDAADIALGAAQFLSGVLAAVTLIREGAAFTRPRP